MIFALRMLKRKIHLTEDAVLHITKPKQRPQNAEMPTSPHLGVLTYATTKIYLGDCKITN